MTRIRSILGEPPAMLLLVPARRQWLYLPHYLTFDGQLLGLIRDKHGRCQIIATPGTHVLTFSSVYTFLRTTEAVTLQPGTTTVLAYDDRNRVWNWLFNADLVFWLLKRFISFGTTWDLVYEVVSWSVFIAWLVSTWLIRNHYFKFRVDDAAGQNDG